MLRAKNRTAKGFNQGWEFAHSISKRIARFLSKNERMSDSLKKMSDSLICSFLVSEMRDLLTSLTSSEWPEQLAHGRSFDLSEMSEWTNSQPWFQLSSQKKHFAHLCYIIYPWCTVCRLWNSLFSLSNSSFLSFSLYLFLSFLTASYFNALILSIFLYSFLLYSKEFFFYNSTGTVC